MFDYRGGKFHNDGVVQVISFAYLIVYCSVSDRSLGDLTKNDIADDLVA